MLMVQRGKDEIILDYTSDKIKIRQTNILIQDLLKEIAKTKKGQIQPKILLQLKQFKSITYENLRQYLDNVSFNYSLNAKKE